MSVEPIELMASNGARTQAKNFDFDSNKRQLNHNVFRYPAKFHPPVAAALVANFSKAGETILDPFCGSGTILVEGIVSGRSVIGSDIDPLAVLVSEAKTSTYDLAILQKISQEIISLTEKFRELDLKEFGDLKDDIDTLAYEKKLVGSRHAIPPIPNLHHWFRRRCIVNLARIAEIIDELECDGITRKFLSLVLASIIRNSSNADPVPVSGLEVTRHMLAKEAVGRSIDVFGLFRQSLLKALSMTEDFIEAGPKARRECAIYNADIRKLPNVLQNQVDCVITSPPYLSAVDYYRRHQLEMYWLKLIATPEERLSIMPNYIGRDKIGLKYLQASNLFMRSSIAKDWISDLQIDRPEKARSLRGYAESMAQSLNAISRVTRANGQIVIVIGDSQIGGRHFPTAEMIKQLVPSGVQLREHYWYPLKNRFMSYTRHNGADIKIEHVLHFGNAR